jgi:2,3-bisphosphoglycerate-dependent phosphoglycerate mutase
MSKLYIVRHAQVAVDPNSPAHLWPLSEAGKRAAEELAARENWDDVYRVYHSPEPKAEQTAQIIAKRLKVGTAREEDLRELHADLGFLPAEQFHARVAAYLSGYVDPAFENYDSAVARIDACVKRIAREAGGRSVVVVSHGRILTAFFSKLLGRRLTGEEWRSIKLPDLSVIDLATWKVERGFFADV